MVCACEHQVFENELITTRRVNKIFFIALAQATLADEMFFLYLTCIIMKSIVCHSLPLAKRPIDIVLIIFFCVNLFFITYIVDLEQLVIADANHFQYPVWPPSKMVDLVHWYGNNFDPLLIARPAWWRATIWIDALFFGPFYVFAIYAYAKGKNWIRFASIVWASVMLTNVSIILFEEVMGSMPHHA